MILTLRVDDKHQELISILKKSYNEKTASKVIFRAIEDAAVAEYEKRIYESKK